MSADRTTPSFADRRAAVERELRERLERSRSPHEPPKEMRSNREHAGLRCVACGKVSGVVSRFCTHCGVKFNAQFVAADGS